MNRLDWHASVYGSRTGREGGYGGGFARSYNNGFDDDPDGGVTFGNQQIVSDYTLRAYGGSSYSRARSVIRSGRMHDMCVAQDAEYEDGLLLSCYVESADGYASDYEVTTVIDEQTGKILESDCTCPAFGRFGGACKHLVALIMRYNEDPEAFETQGRHTRHAPSLRTSRALTTFMHQEDQALQTQSKNRQLELLKAVGKASDQGSVGAITDTNVHMPIGSVSFRPTIEQDQRGGWFIKFRLIVPSQGVSYVIKNVDSLLYAVNRQEFVSYGKKLAFVHTRDSFDDIGKHILDILDRAQRIRDSINRTGYHYGLGSSSSANQELLLSDDEIAEILELFVDQDRTIDYVPRNGWHNDYTSSHVVSGDPDLGLVITRLDHDANSGVAGSADTRSGKPGSTTKSGEYDSYRAGEGKPTQLPPEERLAAVLSGKEVEDKPKKRVAGDSHGFNIEHRQYLEAMVAGSSSKFAIVEAAGRNADMGQVLDNVTTFYQCSDQFYRNRKLAQILCGDGSEDSVFLAVDDVDEFSRTILPRLEPLEDDQAVQSAEYGEPVSRVRHSRGLPVVVPPELLKKRRIACHIEIYLDRDRSAGGVTCDVQARYGDRRFHVFSGIDAGGVTDGIVRDKDAERLAVEAVRHYFPMPEGTMAFIPESDDDAIYALLSEGLQVLRGVGEIFATPAFDGLTSCAHPTIKVGLSVRSGLVEVSPIADEIDPEDVPALLNSYRKRRRYHRLRNGAFVDIRNIDATAVDEVANDLGVKPSVFENGSVEVPAFEAYYLDHQVDESDKDSTFRSYINDMRVIDPDVYSVPKSLTSIMRPYQVEGFRWLNAVCDKGFGGILADEMGLGKTLQFLSLLVFRQEQRDAAKASQSGIIRSDTAADGHTKTDGSIIDHFAGACDDSPLSFSAGRGVLNSSNTMHSKAQTEGTWIGGPVETEYSSNRVIEKNGFINGGFANDGFANSGYANGDSTEITQTSHAVVLVPNLIVCPASLVYNWAAECEKFAPNLRIATVAGNKTSRRAILATASDYDVLVTSYDLLRRDIEDYEGVEFDCMALDEAQYIKNHATKSARAVRSINAAHRFALTGTPIENRLSELWSIFDFLMPGILGSYQHFRERFEMPILSGDETAQAKLQAFIGPFILRRLKSQVLKDLPDKIENVITVQLQGEQRKLYAALEQRLRATLLKEHDIEFKTGKIQILAQLTKLRQVCCDPRLLYANVGQNVVKKEVKVWGAPSRTTEEIELVDGSAVTADGRPDTDNKRSGGAIEATGTLTDSVGTAGNKPNEAELEKRDHVSASIAGVNNAVLTSAESAVSPATPTKKAPRKVSSAKLDAIEELVSSCQNAGRKMLIFSQFTSYLDLIAERLRKNDVQYDVITGATTKRRRLELVDQFNRDDTPVFLISLKAGNTGLNLTGACVVVHADPWWNAAAQNQATDRAHRIGQTQDVNVYQIVAKNTIEERILNLQHTKSDLAARFVDSASNSGSSMDKLTKDDLLELLG